MGFLTLGGSQSFEFKNTDKITGYLSSIQLADIKIIEFVDSHDRLRSERIRHKKNQRPEVTERRSENMPIKLITKTYI